MASILIKDTIDYTQQLSMMNEDARYDVADSSDEESLRRRMIGITSNPPKVPKVFLSNDCVFNCAYCCCRAGREDKHRYTNEPRRMAEICVAEALRNGRGVFLTSSVYKCADTTEEMIVETLRIIRDELNYKGYVHAKVMPGTDEVLIRRAAAYADRLSVNIEVARSEAYKEIARQKTRDNILEPMSRIAAIVAENRMKIRIAARGAVSQTTQLMAGAAGEDDRTILNLSDALYKKYSLARVYYTAFTYPEKAKGYDREPANTPYWRMARLYQADRLMKLYGFDKDDITPESEPFLYEDIDPKTAWALRHPQLFPVEVNRASFEELLRVPGFGHVAAQRIIEARRLCPLSFDTLAALKIPLKRASYFILCGGRSYGFRPALEPAVIRNALSETNKLDSIQLSLPSVFDQDE